MSRNAQDQRTTDAGIRRSNKRVWFAVSWLIAGLVPLFGFYFGLAGCVCALLVVLGRGYSARQRGVAVVAVLLGTTLAAFWWWFTADAQWPR